MSTVTEFHNNYSKEITRSSTSCVYWCCDVMPQYSSSKSFTCANDFGGVRDGRHGDLERWTTYLSIRPCYVQQISTWKQVILQILQFNNATFDKNTTSPYVKIQSINQNCVKRSNNKFIGGVTFTHIHLPLFTDTHLGGRADPDIFDGGQSSSFDPQ